MDFKIDENLPVEVVDLLVDNGHDAVTVFDQKLVGEPDARIAEVCRKEERILVTLDTDFYDIRTYPPEEFNGLIVLRPRKQSKAHVLTLFSRMLKILPQEPIRRRLWIVEEGRIRIRG